MAGYLGNIPTAVPLSSADLADGIITSAKIADGAIVNADINASSAIALSKLSATGTSLQVLRMNSGATALEFATPASGITEADQWRITANVTFAGSTQDLTSNWERNDSTGFGYIGTGMTQSSGIFTFPTTGYYLIEHTALCEPAGNNRYFGGMISVTTNNSSYSAVTQPFESGHESGANGLTTASFIFDVTSTANCKVKFTFYNSTMTSVTVMGSSGLNYTHSTFIRLGDT